MFILSHLDFSKAFEIERRLFITLFIYIPKVNTLPINLSILAIYYLSFLGR